MLFQIIKLDMFQGGLTDVSAKNTTTGDDRYCLTKTREFCKELDCAKGAPVDTECFALTIRDPTTGKSPLYLHLGSPEIVCFRKRISYIPNSGPDIHLAGQEIVCLQLAYALNTHVFRRVACSPFLWF